MSNILNHNRDIFQFDLCKTDYWDFHISLNNSSSYNEEGLVEQCLSAYIDLSDDECIWFDTIFSKPNYTWESAINYNSLVFNNFGFYSVDNGRTHYEQDKITNREFFDIYTKTKYTPLTDDKRLILYKVNGNHQIYDYSNDITYWNDKFQVSKLNGGWYQGFFCANDGKNYKTLPTDIGNGWCLDFVLNKENFHNEKTTLNSIHPENKGIFFYIGTRAENKWWEKYLTNHEFDWCVKNGLADDYADEEYINKGNLNIDYFEPFVEKYEEEGVFDKEYFVQKENDGAPAFEKEYNDDEPCDICDNYVTDEYYEKDLVIDEDMKIETSEGYDLYQPNIKEFETDNKFLIFDRTCDGQTADKWDEENPTIKMHYIKKPDLGNYFELMHRGCDGYDAKKIEELINVENKEYNVLKDIYRNALAFQIKDDGTIGYKYLLKDCDSEEENYKIESEFTNNSIIEDGLWYNINIKILPVKHRADIVDDKCIKENSIEDSMQIYIYVNGKLVFISKVLPMLNLKPLDDLYEKQQGVPFNVSIGGGTQGLAEVVYLNYLKIPEYTLPLEKEFGGSFIGWLKSFRFYTCPLNYTEIVINYNFSKIL
jgi:hypothetical protein